ncbi:hypothetical protein EMIHUDRAFT_199159 [Emiliania huxleyi CCMP1516]|uniref:Uncharacterized protein n=2 Tax=Emiliania huxleyi TaxID=2903 RepID=A0A0D3I2D8_EMIH1|nr:hypothetical protein EMIHUDRAFT_199159 [Emiliania huxleyi CCMP1516]EOD05423.1 hypothetical protein EMIHUDRAFT_199159 [Emiliania huxleyi CCMP1516]|eukprot:XP_005757852.1 hypothetical protein EMIHUDRAFT_199159 [Emiliania huxleyi CCMP1516]
MSSQPMTEEERAAFQAAALARLRNPPERVVPDRLFVEAAEYDVLQRLTQQDYNELMDEVVAGTVGRMTDERRAELHAGDLELIQQRVGVGVDACIARYEQAQQPLRFVRGDRVVCNIGGDCPLPVGRASGRGRLSGDLVSVETEACIAATHEEDPADPTGQTVLPYVKIDPPEGRLISVPTDEVYVCRAEVCFGQREDGLEWTSYCLPPPAAKPAAKPRRFAAGDRVACAVEDPSDAYSVWAAGTATLYGEHAAPRTLSHTAYNLTAARQCWRTATSTGRVRLQ